MNRTQFIARQLVHPKTCGTLLIGAAMALSVGAGRADDDAAGAPTAVSSEFTAFDRDENGMLSLEEFVKSRPHEEWRSAGALFYRSDVNADGSLSPGEFAQMGQSGQTAENARKGKAPRFRLDAAVVEAENALRAIEALLTAIHGEKAGRVDERDWPARQFAEKAGALGGVPFSAWDRDGDGFVVPAERRLLVEIAYGIRRPDGQLLRKPGGHVAYLGYMRLLDKDRDDAVSRDEFIAGYHEGAKNADRFAERDKNGDGQLTFAELAESGFFLDVYSEFCKFDADGDGRVTAAEAVAQGGRHQNALARRLVPAFDLDGSGALEVDEFVLSPLGSPLADWYMMRIDADHDGRLSFTEYYTEQMPELYGTARHFFGRFDRDGDGFLSRREIDFRLNLEKVPSEAALADIDRNDDGQITIADLIGRDNRPAPGEHLAVLWWEERAMRMEEALRAADDDHDEALSPQEFGRHRAVLVASILGKSPPKRPPTAPLAAAIDRAAGAAAGTWTWAGLIAGNVLLLAGAAWFVRRRALS